MDFQTQLNELKGQVKSDFQFIMIALGDVTNRMDSISKQMEENAQGMRLVAGKIAHQEERFEIILDLVQQEMDRMQKNQIPPETLAEIFSRLEALEKRPAA